MILSDASAELLVQLLRAEPGFEHARLDGPPEPLTGGFWASISRLHLTGVAPLAGTLVLRVMPDELMAAKETVFQAELSRQGFPVPAVRISGDRSVGLGGPFLLMDDAPGRPPLAGLDGVAALRRLPSIAGDLPRLLGEVTARLHALDPQPIIDALDASVASASAASALDATSTVPTGPVDIGSFLAVLADEATELKRDDLGSACGWLATHRPPSRREVICHGDLHPFNLLVDGGRWTLLDWTTALLADPAYDLAFTTLMLRHPPLVTPRPLRPVVAAAGAFLGRRFMTAYAKAGGDAPGPATLRWFTGLHALRILLEVESRRRETLAPEHSGHPWTTIEPVARRILADITNTPMLGLPDG